MGPSYVTHAWILSCCCHPYHCVVILHNFAAVSRKYQEFLIDAEKYYIQAFDISPQTAKAYRGRGLPPKFRKINLHPPLPPDQIHANPDAAAHHAAKLRLKELGILLQFPPHMHQDHRASLVLAINQLAQKLNYQLSNSDMNTSQYYIFDLRQNRSRLSKFQSATELPRRWTCHSLEPDTQYTQNCGDTFERALLVKAYWLSFVVRVGDSCILWLSLRILAFVL